MPRYNQNNRPPIRRHFRFRALFLWILCAMIASPIFFIIFHSSPAAFSASDNIAAEIFRSPRDFKLQYVEMETKLKVFVYPPADFLCSEPRKLRGRHGSEAYFFKNLQESRFITKDPNRAHLFFIPSNCRKFTVSEQLQKVFYQNLDATIQDSVLGLRSNYPFWNRSLGADHFYVACHDPASLVTHPPPPPPGSAPALIKNSIRVVCSQSYNGQHSPHKDVTLQQILQPLAPPAARNDVKERTVLAFWAGSQNSKLRDMLVSTWMNDTEVDIQNNRINKSTKGHISYQEKFHTSKFCICPGGSQSHGGHIALAIHYGCVPVILSDYFALPFDDILDWSKFSVKVKEKDVYNLKNILRGIPDEEYKVLQNNTVKAKKHFQWNSPPMRLDTFHMEQFWQPNWEEEHLLALDFH